MLKINIPNSLHEMFEGVPLPTTTDEFGSPVLQNMYAAVACELMECLRYASQAQEPHIFFNPMRTAGEQRIWEFGVNDLTKTRTNEINWHGQNTSQWLYAGCILLQDGKVSRHH